MPVSIDRGPATVHEGPNHPTGFSPRRSKLASLRSVTNQPTAVTLPRPTLNLYKWPGVLIRRVQRLTKAPLSVEQAERDRHPRLRALWQWGEGRMVSECTRECRYGIGNIITLRNTAWSGAPSLPFHCPPPNLKIRNDQSVSTWARRMKNTK